MKKVLLIIGLALFVVGCNNPMKKSVTKELAVEELKSINDKDTTFLKFYSECFENSNYKRFLSDKVTQVVYRDITYKELYEYYQQINDVRWQKSIVQESNKLWDEKYHTYEYKFDSIIKQWEAYINEFDGYIDISFDFGVDDRVLFKIIPKKQEISNLGFCYNLKFKETNKVVIDKELVWYNNKFSEPITISTELSSTNLSRVTTRVESKNGHTVLSHDDYEIQYQVFSLESPDLGTMPFSIMRYFEKLYSYDDNSIYNEWVINDSKEQIIQEFIDEDYKSLLNYTYDYRKSKEKDLNPLCYEFIQYLTH